MSLFPPLVLLRRREAGQHVSPGYPRGQPQAAYGENKLVDAKFLGHPTELNTQALLGIASDLLGQLTDLRFGFAGKGP